MEVSEHLHFHLDCGDWSEVARLHLEASLPALLSPLPSSMSLSPNDKFTLELEKVCLGADFKVNYF